MSPSALRIALPHSKTLDTKYWILFRPQAVPGLFCGGAVTPAFPP